MKVIKSFLLLIVLWSIFNQPKAFPSSEVVMNVAADVEKSQPQPTKGDKKDDSFLRFVSYLQSTQENGVSTDDFLRLVSEFENSEEDKKDIKEDIKKGDTKAMKEGDTKQNGTVASNYFDQEIQRAFETTFTNIKDGIFNFFGRK